MSGKTPISDIHKVLLVGYNGANNTGAEARLLTIIKEVRMVFGSGIEITIPTLSKENSCRYIKEEPKLRIVTFPPVYFLAFRKLIKVHDLVVLVEGSCYMDGWTSYLLWAWLWATRCAHKFGKLVVAYAVDAGSLSVINRKLVQLEVSKTDLIMTRTGAAADRLKAWKVNAPLEVTADPAFNFHPEPTDHDLLKQFWPEATTGVIGLAAVDFYLWPVVFRLWGRNRNCYRWPYYHSDSRQRRRAREFLAKGYANFGDGMIEKYSRSFALLCMEQVDEPFARLIRSYMRHSEKIRIFSARDYNASQMTDLLRSLELLITSRYHAGVLSTAAAVPQIAINHDQRLRDLYRDFEIADEYFLDYTSPDLFQVLEQRAEALLQNPLSQQELLGKNYQLHQLRARLSPEYLKQMMVYRTKQ
ncbi:MAG TPA: polysaccharide pyruvyl transferase family protein [Bacillota bacterium]|nr:polysaccharide pyruvyl transferase family protein [Bacillota bacterium]